LETYPIEDAAFTLPDIDQIDFYEIKDL